MKFCTLRLLNMIRPLKFASELQVKHIGDNLVGNN